MPAHWNKRHLLSRRDSPAWAILGVGVGAAVLAWAIADSRVQQHGLETADRAIDNARTAIETRLVSSYSVIYGLQGLFRASDHVSRAEFHRYSSGLGLAGRHPAIRSINFAELVPAARLDEFITRVRNDRSLRDSGYPNFAVRPAGERPEYLPITYTESAFGESGLGLDLLTDDRRESVDRARDTGNVVVSGRIKLASAAADDPGLSVRLPVYRNGMPISTLDERRAAFNGVLSATFLARGLVEDILTHLSVAAMSVRLYDRFAISGGEALGAKAVEYVLFEKLLTQSQPPESGRFERNVALEVGGRTWYLNFTGSVHDFVTPTDRVLPRIVLFGIVW